MGKDKTILEKITDTVKDIATLATDAAGHALKPEPSLKADERMAAYVPLAADGLVSDPTMVPVAAAPVAQKRTAARRKAKKASKPTARKAQKTSRNSVAKAAKKS